MKSIIEEMIEQHEKRCAKAGHYWAESAMTPGYEYCQSCGATRKQLERAGDYE